MGRDVFSRFARLLAHRGPDGEGLIPQLDSTPLRHSVTSSLPHFLLAHRRLAIIEPTPAGAQPMRLSNGVVAYNGELYNDAEVRADLQREGVRLRTRCDTETFGEAWLAWGISTPSRLRGMYAGAILDEHRASLILTRDPLGIKPLYWARATVDGVDHVAFASEVRPLVELLCELLGTPPLPDMGVVSAYCTTIRTTMGDRTMFEGVRTLLPGQTLSFDLRDATLPCEKSDWFARTPQPFLRGATSRDVASSTREVITESVRRHLRSDVPVCVLLSGGLDSAIIASVARQHLDSMRTFCAGAREEGAPESPDFAFARSLAASLGSLHEEAIVTRERFFASWRDLGEHLMTPLSTPNEVAILAVSRALREAGCVVALSGEGADEIFAGYDAPLDIAARALREGRCPDRGAEGLLALRAATWIPPEQKHQLFTPDAHAAMHLDGVADGGLLAWFASEFARIAGQREDDHPLQAHARWLRRTNLPGLLQRLDTATMRAGVEGRTPFADSVVMDFGESLPLHEKFAHDAPVSAVRTKLALRRAFADLLPPEIIARPKASFPLPFERWLGAEALQRADTHLAPALDSLESTFARETFAPPVHQAIRSGQVPWTIAWPVLNLSMWGARCWG